MMSDETNKDYSDCAVVYVATGPRYVREALQSVQSVRRHMPDVKIVLHTDVLEPQPRFDQVERLEQPTHSEIDKVHCYRNVQQSRLLFLDTDTYLVAPLYDVFDLLDRFDLAFCHAPWRLSWDKKTKKPWLLDGIPEAFAEPNTGVIGFRNSPDVRQMFMRWADVFDEHKRRGNVLHDQPAFRQCLWESRLSSYVMPPEYNCRLIFPTYINGSVKVIHARVPDIDSLAQAINEGGGHKIYDPFSGRVLNEATFKKLNRGARKVLFKWLQ